MTRFGPAVTFTLDWVCAKKPSVGAAIVPTKTDRVLVY